MKKLVHIYIAVCFFVLLITSCKKDEVNDKEVLIISPEILVSYAGKNWNSISSQFENKKDYWYTTLNMGNTLAAISLPVKDPQAPAYNYKLTINLNLQNTISSISLICTDTLDITIGNQLMLYYYDHAFSQLTGVYRKSAKYNIEQFPLITVDELLVRLRSLNCQYPILDFRTDKMSMSAGYAANLRSFYLNIYAP